MSGSTANPADAGFVQAYQNFQLPPDSFWVDAPTMQNLLQDVPPTIASTNPNLYYTGAGGTLPNTMSSYTDPTSGQTVGMSPWNLNPAYQQGGSEGALNPLIVSSAIPSPGGTFDAATGTYSDPGSAGAPGTYYSYNLGTETATPTQQSLDITLKNIEQHQIPGWGNMLMGLPLDAFGALMGAGLPGMLAGVGGAGAADLGDVATLGSFADDLSPIGGDVASLGADVAPAGYAGDVATLGSFAPDAGTGSSDLLGNAMQAYSSAKPYISGAQDLMKLAQSFNAPQQAQTQPVSLLAQPATALVHR